MRNVTYKSAGAGSGKTYYLTHVLADILKDKKAEPEQVILTTFTKKAAKDFKERSKKVLYENGLYSEASRLDNALIGTIHGVALQLISKYWFFLGLSPSLETITEEDTNLYQSQSLSTLPTDEEIAFLKDFVHKMDICDKNDNYFNSKGYNHDYNFWKEPLKQIIAMSVNHSVDDYEKSREESKKFFSQFVIEGLEIVLPRGKALDKELKELEKLPEMNKNQERVKIWQELWDERKFPSIPYYIKIGKLIGKMTKSMKKNFPEVVERGNIYSNLWQSKLVYDLICRYIDIMFNLAERWRKEYDKFKRDRNLLDFNDQERYLLELLNKKECSEEISKEFKYVFVDEFQDCSPIQVKIFERLSELVEHSYWVGDNKQAIYGFRASDPELTETVMNIVETTPGEGNLVDTLDTSHRSVREIVECCNRMFLQAFNKMDRKKVELKPKEESEPDSKPLTVWPSASVEKICQGVVDMIEAGEEPSNIAILSRNKFKLKDLATFLSHRGIPVNYSSMQLKDSKVTLLIGAALEIVDNDLNYLAKATVGFLTEPGFDTEKIIERVLGSVDEKGKRHLEFLNQLPLVERISKIGERHKHQSISKLVESVLIEAQIYEEAKKLCSGDEAERIIDTVISEAARYEESAQRLGLVPTISGFVDFILNEEISVPGNPDGVSLVTIHSAKGLEWKNVVIVELDQNPEDVDKFIKKDIFGVHFHKVSLPSKENLYPEVYITLLPYLYNYGNSKVPEFVAAKINNSDDFKPSLMRKIFEETRVLYVGLTRPKERLILTETKESNAFKWFEVVNIKDAEDVEGLKNFYGFEEEHPVPEEEMLLIELEESPDYTFGEVTEKIPSSRRNCAPSSEKGKNPIKKIYPEFGAKRIPFTALPADKDEADLGTCVHHIFQSFEYMEPSEDMMKQIIREHGFEKSLHTTDEIVKSWQFLLDTISNLHGEIRNHRHERRFRYQKDGKVYTGSIDMTIETDNGTVLVDFKSCPMGRDAIKDIEGDHYAGLYGGQMKCYSQALEMNGKKPLATYVYYPVAGLLVELDMDKSLDL